MTEQKTATAVWDPVTGADGYTVTLWEDAYHWHELTDEEREAYENGSLIIDEEHSDIEAGRLGWYEKGLKVIAQAENVEACEYGFSEAIAENGESRYYVYVQAAADGTGAYISGPAFDPDAEYEKVKAGAGGPDVYNHLTRPYNLKWDGSVAMWQGGNTKTIDGEYCHDGFIFQLYRIDGPDNYTMVTMQFLEPGERRIDMSSYFAIGCSYVFTVEAYSLGSQAVTGLIQSWSSEYSPVYKVKDPEIPDDDVDRTDWIAISTPEEWVDLASTEDVPEDPSDPATSIQAAAFSQKYYLTADLDFSKLKGLYRVKTASIGNVTNMFNGTMDGNGHTITGLTFANGDSGLFSYVGASGLVYGLTVENCNVKVSDNAGIIAVRNYGLIQNCMVSGCHITADTGAVIGGLVSRNYGIIRESCVKGGSLQANSVTANGHAGFAGSLEAGGLFEKCWTSMDVVSSSYYAGGFVGLGYGGTVRNFLPSGT